MVMLNSDMGDVGAVFSVVLQVKPNNNNNNVIIHLHQLNININMRRTCLEGATFVANQDQ